ncbi:MAG: Na+/H+ antiporter subunit E [Sulfurimonas sp.]|nr:Na+/H+ antiporter subunit E [Sulfurimonas sp.]
MFLSIWLILVNGDVSSLWLGLPFVLIATIMSMTLNPPICWKFSAFLKFIPFYFKHSLMGGVDVMLRVFHPNLPINPGLIEYQLSIQKGLPQDMIANVLNLLPGTLSVELEDDLLYIHVLDIENDIKKEVQTIENYLNNIFCEGKEQ